MCISLSFYIYRYSFFPFDYRRTLDLRRNVKGLRKNKKQKKVKQGGGVVNFFHLRHLTNLFETLLFLC
jgi:hypothetical protein